MIKSAKLQIVQAKDFSQLNKFSQDMFREIEQAHKFLREKNFKDLVQVMIGIQDMVEEANSSTQIDLEQ